MVETPLFTWRRALTDPDGPLTTSQRIVGLVLSTHMSADGDSCFVSVLTIARECGWRSRSSAKEAIRILVGAGYLEKERRGYGQTCNYFAALPGVGRLAGHSGAAERPRGGRQGGQRVGGRAAREDVHEDVPPTPRRTDGVGLRPTAVHGGIRKTPNPSNPKPSNPKSRERTTDKYKCAVCGKRYGETGSVWEPICPSCRRRRDERSKRSK